jgi:hypothetical protein
MPQFSFRIGRTRPSPMTAPAPALAATRAGTRRRLAGLAVPVAVALAFVTVSRPVLAATCIPTVVGFSPGQWYARGISIENKMEDDISVTYLAGTGGFDLSIDQHGAASGNFALSGESQSLALGAFDDSRAHEVYTKTGTLSGTGIAVRIEGEMSVVIGGLIDVEPNHDGDQSNQSGNDLYGFGNQYTEPFSGEFAPSAANCNQAFGSLSGPVKYGSASAGADSFFMAYRRGGTTPSSVDVQGQLAQLMEDAEVVLNMNPIDTDALGNFVIDMLTFDSLLASLESCDPGHELDMGPAWAFIQSVMLNTIRTFLTVAQGGEYVTSSVIDVMRIWIQGGSLGWREEDCLSPNSADDYALDLLTQFEDILLARYEIARQLFDDGEMAIIAAAGYQYGLPRVIAAVEGN